MPYSHHSHSGQFCAHAKGSLEDMVKTAISKNMKVFAFTEHMPRDLEDFYPEEMADHPDANSLVRLMDEYFKEAFRLRDRFQSQIEILVGFESEWIRPSSLSMIQQLQRNNDLDLFVGSIHHVHTIPIDFDRPMYEDARERSGGSDETLFRDYFDAQYDMLRATEPPIVGHFDLIRLMSDDPNRSFRQMEGIWSRIVRNLEFISSYGGVLELNSSALRKGMHEPYPQVEICQSFLGMKGRFVLSDDAHALDQVGLNYARVLDAIKAAGIEHIHFLTSRRDRKDTEKFRSISVSELEKESF